MNDFDTPEDLYELSAAEGKRNTQGLINALLYLVLAAVVAGLGFIQASWRGGQKTVGLGIELIWLTFAALNMITFFAVERGQPLQSWQNLWIQYGLPMSALIAGALTYTLMRVDPAHKRDQEHAATAERVDAMRFKFRQKARLSPAMLNIEKQRAFMQVIEDLRRQGYTEPQIRFMISHTPELLSDGDENGQPDVLETGQPTLIPLARPVSNNTYSELPSRPQSPPPSTKQGDKPNGVPAAAIGSPPDFH